MEKKIISKLKLEALVREAISDVLLSEALTPKDILMLANIAAAKEKLTSHEKKSYLTSLAKDLKGSGVKKYKNFDLDDWSEDIEAYISERGL